MRVTLAAEPSDRSVLRPGRPGVTRLDVGREVPSGLASSPERRATTASDQHLARASRVRGRASLSGVSMSTPMPSATSDERQRLTDELLHTAASATKPSERHAARAQVVLANLAVAR